MTAFAKHTEHLMSFHEGLDSGSLSLYSSLVSLTLEMLNFSPGLFLQVTQAELHRQFHSLGAGMIEDVRVQKDKGFGFVRYRTHEEAAFAIQAANGRVICGKSVKVLYLYTTVLGFTLTRLGPCWPSPLHLWTQINVLGHPALFTEYSATVSQHIC